jgi:hypothetical protein
LAASGARAMSSPAGRTLRSLEQSIIMRIVVVCGAVPTGETEHGARLIVKSRSSTATRGPKDFRSRSIEIMCLPPLA